MAGLRLELCGVGINYKGVREGRESGGFLATAEGCGKDEEGACEAAEEYVEGFGGGEYGQHGEFGDSKGVVEPLEKEEEEDMEDEG